MGVLDALKRHLESRRAQPKLPKVRPAPTPQPASSPLPSPDPQRQTINPRQPIDMILLRYPPHCEIKRFGKVLLDTGCEVNMISQQFAELLGWKESNANTPTLLGTGHGGGGVASLGEVKARWYISSSKKARYEIAIFHVVKDNTNEVVIGSDTIAELGIFEPGTLFAGSLTAHIPQADGSVVTQETEHATRERARSLGEQRRDREQKQVKALESKQKLHQSCP